MCLVLRYFLRESHFSVRVPFLHKVFTFQADVSPESCAREQLLVSEIHDLQLKKEKM